MTFPFRSRRLVVVEDVDRLGYRLIEDPLLDVMSVAEWRDLERAALDDARR